MLTYTIRRLLVAIPTLLFIALAIFMLLELAPGDPMAQVPLTVPPEVKEAMRQALGLGEPVHIRFWKWLVQFFYIEPLRLIDYVLGTGIVEGQQRIISWQTRSPVMDIVVQIESEDNVPYMWGDAGVAHVSVCPRHLEFAVMSWACH